MGQFGHRRRREREEDDDDDEIERMPRMGLATVKSWHYPKRYGMSKATFQGSYLDHEFA